MTTTSPPTATERSSFNGTSNSAANPIETATPERAIVWPACRAATSAACVAPAPAARASRNRLTMSSA